MQNSTLVLGNDFFFKPTFVKGYRKTQPYKTIHIFTHFKVLDWPTKSTIFLRRGRRVRMFNIFVQKRKITNICLRPPWVWILWNHFLLKLQLKVFYNVLLCCNTDISFHSTHSVRQIGLGSKFPSHSPYFKIRFGLWLCNSKQWIRLKLSNFIVAFGVLLGMFASEMRILQLYDEKLFYTKNNYLSTPESP